LSDIITLLQVVFNVKGSDELNKTNLNTDTHKDIYNAIHPATRIGTVHLSVADLDRQVRFYQEVIGLQTHWREGATVGLGAGGHDLLRLTQIPGARRFRGTTGLYHFALLLPSRRELARVIGRLLEMGYPNYPTDHVMTKTTYLDDPEGQNIELYADTPEDGTFTIKDGIFGARRANGALSDGREPLDVEALLGELSPGDRLDQPMPSGTTVGHVHLYVADLDEGLRFYHGVLGFDDMGLARSFRMGMVSAGGYHHHIGFNNWVGQGAPPPPPDSLGLRHFSVVLPDQAGLDSVVERLQKAGVAMEPREAGFLVRDPSQNGILLTTHAELPREA
jgi:catechol 2,3-dioxygenase